MRVLNADGPVSFSMIDDSGNIGLTVSAFSYVSSSDTSTVLGEVSGGETLSVEFDPT